MDTTELAQMTTLQKLQAMEALWDSPVHEMTGIEPMPWHGNVLVKRKQNLEDGNALFFSLEELRSRHER